MLNWFRKPRPPQSSKYTEEQADNAAQHVLYGVFERKASFEPEKALALVSTWRTWADSLDDEVVKNAYCKRLDEYEAEAKDSLVRIDRFNEARRLQEEFPRMSEWRK